MMRARWAGLASLAMLAAVPAWAQEPAPATPATPPVGSPRTGPAPGRGGIGALIGASYFYAAEEYARGALPRFDFSGQFRYVLGRRARLQVSPGFAWSAYSKHEPPPFTDPRFPADQTKEHYLTLLVPISVQVQMTWGKSPWHYHLGVGPGIYRVWVQNHRKVLMDPASLRLHRGLYAGFTGEVGVERFLGTLPNTSVEVSAAHHYVLATRDDQFPSGWNSSLGVVALRAGANYYFDLMRQPKEPELPLPGVR
jgi:hypothetical protein